MHQEGLPSLTAAEAARIIDLLHRMEPLKHLPRTGWIDRGVAGPETVAAHSWRLAMLAWIVADALALDAHRAVQLALVHDLPEAVTGDATPFTERGLTPEAQRDFFINPHRAPLWRDPATRLRKVETERHALHDMLAGQSASLQQAIADAWEEYEAGVTAEARLVRQLDKLEAYAQGIEYAQDERLPDPATLHSFRYDSERLLREPAARALLAALGEGARAAPGSE